MQPTPETAPVRYRDWGHLALICLIAAVTGLYLRDAIAASDRTENLILILPAAALALGLCAAVAVVAMRGTAVPEQKPALGTTPVLMGLFALYIITLPALGLDVGSALFVAAAMLADGERRPAALLVVPLAFATAATLAFAALVPYPLPTLVL